MEKIEIRKGTIALFKFPSDRRIALGVVTEKIAEGTE
jgi:hypothetical protein